MNRELHDASQSNSTNCEAQSRYGFEQQNRDGPTYNHLTKKQHKEEYTARREKTEKGTELKNANNCDKGLRQGEACGQ